MGGFEAAFDALGRALHHRRNRPRSGDARCVPRDWCGDGRGSESAGRRPMLAEDRPCRARAGHKIIGAE